MCMLHPPWSALQVLQPVLQLRKSHSEQKVLCELLKVHFGASAMI
jgi:hypothetical protein